MKYMFKFAAKLTFLSVFLTVAFMSISTGEASADTHCTFGSGDNFGVRATGQHSNQMGGLKVKARYASGGAIDINYRLKSDVPGDHPAQTSNGHPYDERIFHWPLGSGRTDDKVFSTGEDLYPGAFNCKGKSVLGPGEPDTRGNQWVLDCVEDGKFVQFWIDEIGNPGGQQGSWTVIIEGVEYPNPKQRFIIKNGDNVRVDLVFHPEQPAGDIQSVECDRIRLVGYSQSDPSRWVKFRVLRGNGTVVLNNKWTNQTDQPHWYQAGLGNTFDSAWPSNVTLRLFVDIGNSYQQVDSWSGRKRCDIPPDSNPNCTHVRFSIPHDSKPLSGNNRWNTPPGQSYYAVYVNDWGSPGRPQNAGSPNYLPNGSGNPPGSGRYNNAPGPWVDYSSYDHPGTETVPQGGAPIDRNLRQHNKVVSGTLVWTLVVYDWFQNSNGVWRIQVQHRETNEVNNCFKASCDIDINGNVPGREGTNAVRAGTVLDGTVTIRNTGVNNLPSWMITNSGTFGLSLTTNFRGGLSPNHLNEAIPPGGEIRKPLADFGLVAPNDINNHTLSLYPDYWGRAGVGPWCNASFRTFKQFNLSPEFRSIQFEYNGRDDAEDPNTAVFNSFISNNAPNPATVSVPVVRILTKNDSPYDSWTSSPLLGSTAFDDSSGVSSSVLGDEYCGRISVAPAHGWQGPGDRVVLDAGPRSAGGCTKIVNRPYLRAYGADVSAGNNFGDADICEPGTGQIRTYTSGRPNKSGSGAQLAAIAINTVEDFTTASLRTSSPTADNGLSFGNNPSPPGEYAGSPICSTDFYGETQSSDPDKKRTTSSGSYNVNNSDHPQVLINNNNVTINGSGSYDKEKVVYVNGDAKITGNIEYVPFADPTEAPALAIVVLGDLYIEDDVTRLDGLYVAQPRADGSGGNIYTCASGSSFRAYNTDEIFANCGGPQGENSNPNDDKQLRVNGAFVANNIHFHRFHKSLRDSKANPSETANNTQASEIFQFSPELYLSQPPFALDASSTTEFPYYTTLPPIL